MFSIYGGGGVLNVFTIHYQIFMLKYNHVCTVLLGMVLFLFRVAKDGRKSKELLCSTILSTLILVISIY